MFVRLASLFLATWLLCVLAAAQSNVRPLPRSALFAESQLGASTSSSRWEDLAAVPSRPESTPKVDMQLETHFQPAADFADTPGSMAIERGGWDAQLGYGAGEDRSFTLDLHTEASFYDFGSSSTLVPGSSKPFNDVYETSLGTSLCVADNEHIAWLSGFEIELSGEDDADIGDALSVGGVGGVRYKANDALTLKVGIAARTRLEDSPWIIPFLGFDWHIDDRWELSAEGPRARLKVDLDDHWTLFGEALYEARQYRLNEDNPLPSGVARDEQITIGSGLSWQPSKSVRVTLRGGIVAWQELTLLDHDGDKVSETETEPGAFGGIGVELSF